jgi:hypothetical protein
VPGTGVLNGEQPWCETTKDFKSGSAVNRCPFAVQSSDGEVVEVPEASDPVDAWKYAFPRPGQTKADTKLPQDFRAKMHLNGSQSSRGAVPGIPFLPTADVIDFNLFVHLPEMQEV